MADNLSLRANPARRFSVWKIIKPKLIEEEYLKKLMKYVKILYYGRISGDMYFVVKLPDLYRLRDGEQDLAKNHEQPSELKMVDNEVIFRKVLEEGKLIPKDEFNPDTLRPKRTFFQRVFGFG